MYKVYLWSHPLRWRLKSLTTCFPHLISSRLASLFGSREHRAPSQNGLLSLQRRSFLLLLHRIVRHRLGSALGFCLLSIASTRLYVPMLVRPKTAAIKKERSPKCSCSCSSSCPCPNLYFSHFLALACWTSLFRPLCDLRREIWPWRLVGLCLAGGVPVERSFSPECSRVKEPGCPLSALGGAMARAAKASR